MRLFLLVCALFGLVTATCSSIDCSTFTSCDQCVSAATTGCCGWCRSNSKCFPGNSAGSTPVTSCPNPAAQWIYGGASKILSQTSGYPVNPIFYSVYLYPGSPLQLPVRVTNPLTDAVPLDLYVVQDVSGSMGDDVATFYSLALSLTVDVLRYQSNPRFGLGSFGDKPTIPYGLEPWCSGGNWFAWPQPSTDYTVQSTTGTFRTQNFAEDCVPGATGFAAKCALTPCPTRTATGGPFNWAFCHELDLTNNYPALQAAVGTLVTHVNGDWPEDQYEGLLFPAVCPMGWRPGARRVVLIATDADPHNAVGTNCTGAACFDRPCTYECKQDLGSSDALLVAARCEQSSCPGNTCADNQVPGAANDYPDVNTLAGYLASNNIVPIIASAKALPDHDDLPTWQLIVNGWGFGKVLELASDSSNLVALIRAALSELSTVMVMTLCATCDQYNQVVKWSPYTGYTDVPAGARRFFTIDMLDADTVELSSIRFSIVGFGEVVINVTNQIPCLGCDGSSDPTIVVDQCGECNGRDVCLGCDGVPYSGAVYDECGVCGGTSTCYDCTGVKWGTVEYDACFVCDGGNASCTDCAGNVIPPDQSQENFLRVDECGICGGDGRSCRGCDGLINSTKTWDNCSVCGGDNSSCVVIDPPPPSAVPAIAGGAIAGAVFATIAIVAVILILGALAKKRWDKMQYMNNQPMTALGSSPLYQETGGWQSNPNAN